jgi:inorganic pyrophosphatase
MKKIIELALKSGEITPTGIINLVNCIDEEQQERAVLLLTENDYTPDGVNILSKGCKMIDDKIHCTFVCIGYNYLKNEVIVQKYYTKDDKQDVYQESISLYMWKKYRDNYIKYLKEKREVNAN